MDTNTERTILINLKFCWRSENNFLLNHQNNFIGILKIMNNFAKNFSSNWFERST